MATTTVKEKETGVQFAASMGFKPDSAPLICLGAGVRTKKIGMINIKAYAVALYVHPEDARPALAGFGAAAARPAALAKDPTYYGALLALPRKSLHLIFVRDVPSKKVAEALATLPGVAADVVETFLALLMSGLGSEVKNAQTMSLVADGGAVLVVLVDGDVKGEIPDAALTTAVFHLFLRESDPVSPSARTAFAAGLPAVLAVA
ncbi:unnamed protein product [Phaeothamnion confervicola]